MATENITSSTTTDLDNAVVAYSVDTKTLDIENAGGGETFWYFDKATANFGYYSEIPEINSAANSLATWSVGKGWEAEDSTTTVLLENLSGMGSDTFQTIMWNHMVMKKIVGDAFCEIIRSKKGELINLLPISPERIRLVISKGRIKRYEVWNSEKWRPIKPENMLHSMNNRLGDQIHGTSQIDAVKWVIDARNEALVDNRKIEHRGMALGIIKYKTSNATKITYANSQVEKAIKNGDMVGIPEDTMDIVDFPAKSIQDRMPWIQYLENFFYQTFGVPRSIATSDGTSEVGGKMGHVIFEPVYSREQMELEADLWNQLAIKVKFNRPPSLAGLQQETEEKNTGQLGIQPNDVEASMTRE